MIEGMFEAVNIVILLAGLGMALAGNWFMDRLRVNKELTELKMAIVRIETTLQFLVAAQVKNGESPNGQSGPSGGIVRPPGSGN